MTMFCFNCGAVSGSTTVYTKNIFMQFIIGSRWEQLCHDFGLVDNCIAQVSMSVTRNFLSSYVARYNSLMLRTL